MDPTSDKRLCLLDGGGIKYRGLYQMYKTQVSCFWTVEEIDFSQDSKDFVNAPKAVKRMIEHILSFFSIADAIVMANITENFLGVVTAPEAVLFYSAQNFIEGVHAETYNDAVVALIPDTEDQKSLLQNTPKFEAVKAKKAFAENWMNSDRPFEEKLIAFAMVEGLLFSASFTCIYWLKTLNKFPGLVQSNELISRDENLHCKFAIRLHSLLTRKCSKETIHRIVHDAVETELVFVNESITDSLDGLSPQDMSDYVKFLADGLLKKMDC